MKNLKNISKLFPKVISLVCTAMVSPDGYGYWKLPNNLFGKANGKILILDAKRHLLTRKRLLDIDTIPALLKARSNYCFKNNLSQKSETCYAKGGILRTIKNSPKYQNRMITSKRQNAATITIGRYKTDKENHKYNKM